MHNRETCAMRVEHDLDCFRVAEEEDGDEDVGNKVHRCHVIVMDEDAVKRLQFGLLAGGIKSLQ